MRVLVVNPNTTGSVTDALVQQARRYLPPDVEVDGLTAKVGPSVVRGQADVGKAQEAIVSLLPEVESNADAIVLGISLDIGLSELRQHVSQPVFALSESTLRQVIKQHGEVVAITVGTHMLPLYADLSARYGFDDKQVHWRAIDDASAFTPGGLCETRKHAFVQHALKLREQHPGASIAFVGALLAGLGEYARSVVPDSLIIEPMQAVCDDILSTLKPTVGVSLA